MDDAGIACGKGRGVMLRKGEIVRTVEEKDFLEALYGRGGHGYKSQRRLVLGVSGEEYCTYEKWETADEIFASNIFRFVCSHRVLDD